MSFDKVTAAAEDSGMLIGYARVSTQDQNLELQTEALTKAGCKKVFEDKVNGSRAERPGLTKAQEALRKGDTLVVWKLDRLGRSVKNLVDLVGELHKQGVQFKSLTDAIDTALLRDASSSTSWQAWLRWNASSPSSELELASKLPASSAARAVAKGR
jgi:predicted site-specific integrase-resolvase